MVVSTGTVQGVSSSDELIAEFPFRAYHLSGNRNQRAFPYEPERPPIRLLQGSNRCFGKCEPFSLQLHRLLSSVLF